MPLYEYRCPNGHTHDELKKVADRETDPCPECGETATQIIGPVNFDWNIGVDMDFPTFAAKWDRLQREKAKGTTWDSNNLRYGGEYERQRKR